MDIDIQLAERLIASQFPEWKGVSLKIVPQLGLDNMMYRLGEKAVARFPRAVQYALQVEKEQRWLPQLAPYLPLTIPTPLALGKPGEGYPWHWSIYSWLEGDRALHASIQDLSAFATRLAEFILRLQTVNPTAGPKPGYHNLYRGGPIAVYDAAMRGALYILKNKIDVKAAWRLWEAALVTSWHKPPVWIHADISATNLLVKKGNLSSVIDFGLMAIGDPAYDLNIVWSFLDKTSREVFRKTLSCDEDTWRRGRALALYKAMTRASGMKPEDNTKGSQCWQIIQTVLQDYHED